MILTEDPIERCNGCEMEIGISKDRFAGNAHSSDEYE